LLPALSRGTAAARATECQQNLRDIGLALRMYLDEWDRYPTTAPSGILLHNDTYGWLIYDDWKETLTPYIGLKDNPDTFAAMKKLRCPQLVLDNSGARINGQYGYNVSGTARLHDAANLGLGGFIDPSIHPVGLRATAESQVRMPVDMIASGDVAPGFLPGESTGAGDGAAVPFAGNMFLPGTSHNGQGNLLFCDGHLESGRQTNWVAATDSARRRWNSDHEPHPQTWER
jgi:prepilin-type processing-associated H-X9-DG protein